MKKLFLICLLLLLAFSNAFAAVAYKDTGTDTGVATTIDITGGVQSFDGSTLSISVLGFATGNASGVSMAASGTKALPVGYSAVIKTIGSAAALTLADGTPGQVLTIIADNASAYTAVLTPATKTGFSTITFNATADSVTLLYLNDTAGWVVIGTNSVTIG